MAQPSLTRRTLMLFGLPEYAVYLASIPVVLYLPFVYSKDYGLSLTDVGLILMVGRISDVITDPLIGYFSDRTRRGDAAHDGFSLHVVQSNPCHGEQPLPAWLGDIVMARLDNDHHSLLRLGSRVI